MNLMEVCFENHTGHFSRLECI